MKRPILCLILTDEETDKLVEVLQGYQDEGPYENGWQSDVLASLAEKICNKIDILGLPSKN